MYREFTPLATACLLWMILALATVGAMAQAP